MPALLISPRRMAATFKLDGESMLNPYIPKLTLRGSVKKGVDRVKHLWNINAKLASRTLVVHGGWGKNPRLIGTPENPNLSKHRKITLHKSVMRSCPYWFRPIGEEQLVMYNFGDLQLLALHLC